MRTAAWTESVSVLDRLSAVLDAFGEDSAGLTITEIARRANLPKSTVSRLAADLVDQGYLDREGARLHLGVRLFELGQGVERPRRLRELARHGMVQLRDATGCHVQLAVADGDDVIVIASAHGHGSHPPVARMGERLLLGSAALDSALEALRHGAAGAEIPSAFEHTRGGQVCVASPVLERRRAVASLSANGSSSSIDADAIAPLVRRTAAALSRALAS
ncbi:MAG: IclR family transcriptional regulator [Microbacterium gubbeenense]|uniref:IclR family transcriptional regulator n=1 Tax=Microbacterium TaxID=33882 RepID=UPI003F9BB2BB